MIVPIRCTLTKRCKGVLEYTGRKEGKFFILKCSVCGRECKD